MLNFLNHWRLSCFDLSVCDMVAYNMWGLSVGRDNQVVVRYRLESVERCPWTQKWPCTPGGRS